MGKKRRKPPHGISQKKGERGERPPGEKPFANDYQKGEETWRAMGKKASWRLELKKENLENRENFEGAPGSSRREECGLQREGK